MDFNRNHFFMAGLVILCLGVQSRLFESYTLNERVSAIINKQASPSTQFMASIGPTPRKVVNPPPWLGLALISVGSVLVLHSLAMPKPGG
jgi:hypothetical protein